MNFIDITFKISCDKNDASEVERQLRLWFERNEVALAWEKLEVEGSEIPLIKTIIK